MLEYGTIYKKNRGRIMKSAEVIINGKNYIYEVGTTLLEISKEFKEEYKNDILVAVLNGKVAELNNVITEDSTLEFYDISSSLGSLVYENGLTFLLIDSFKRVLKMDITINHSIDKGVYFETSKIISESDLEKIDLDMNEMVQKNVPIEKKLVNRMEAIKYYTKHREDDKVNILKYTTNTNVNLYKLNNTYDYFFSYLPISTGYLKKFNLTYISSNGFVISYPNLYTNKMHKYKHHEKLFNEFNEYNSWTQTLGVRNVTSLNYKISMGNFNDIIFQSEAFQNNKLYKIAEKIYNNVNSKVILISGPSSSGKTTTSKKLKLYLKNFGLDVLSISIDDFFLDKEDTPRKENGDYDFESVNAIDINLFNKTLKKLISYEKVKLPRYNFILGKKEFETVPTKLNENQILIIEGLHALNDVLTNEIDKKYKFKIYLSPLTVLNIDNHNRFKTTDNRLLRRIVRDNRTRGYSASDTLASWNNVREGEEKNIFNFQDSSDVVFNTSLVYELNVLKTYVEPLLYSVEENDPNYKEALRLLNLLKNILPMPSEDVPRDSIIREFIGNSYFE